MFIKVTEQDGNLATATNATLNWSEFTGPQQADKIYRVNSDIDHVNKQIYAATSDPRSITWTAQFFNSSTQAWEEKYPYDVLYDDLIGLNIIKISGVKTYICTDEEINQIPNYLTKPSIRYRINENVTAANITGFKHYQQANSALAAAVFICPYAGSANHTGMQFLIAVTDNNNGNKVKLTFYDLTTDNSAAFSVQKGSKDVAVSMELNDQGYIDADLASRVKQLEYEMSVVKETMLVYDQVIKDIPAITAALQANVTKFYVAR